MKRDHQQATCGFGGGPDESASASMAASCGGGIGKGKLWEEDQDASGMDELLAVLGYKVRSSDMADVAQKLEQLEMAMGTAQDDGISHLACDTIHYNPSDLSGWVDSMLSEFTNPPNSHSAGGNGGGGGSSSISSMDFSTPTQSHKSAVFRDDSEYDLRAIPGVAAYPQADESDKDSCRKRMKTSAGGSSNSGGSSLLAPAAVSSPSSSSSPPPPIAAADSAGGADRFAGGRGQARPHPPRLRRGGPTGQREARRRARQAHGVARGVTDRRHEESRDLLRRSSGSADLQDLPTGLPRPFLFRYLRDALLRDLPLPEIRPFHGEPGDPRGLRHRQSGPRHRFRAETGDAVAGTYAGPSITPRRAAGLPADRNRAAPAQQHGQFAAGRVEAGPSGGDDRRGIRIPRVRGQQPGRSGAGDAGFAPRRRGGGGGELGVRAPPPAGPERRDGQGAVDDQGDEAEDRDGGGAGSEPQRAGVCRQVYRGAALLLQPVRLAGRLGGVAVVADDGESGPGDVGAVPREADLQRGGVRRRGPSRAARDVDSVEGADGIGRVRPGSPRVERVQAGEHAARPVRRRRRVQGGGEQRGADARVAHEAAHRDVGVAAREMSREAESTQLGLGLEDDGR
ncbi:unnamed protein product [Linum tenue]|uniref:Transcriptional factor DELLA N-terminal domain-containing protein n=1 Tax=Linum tenue TaxID=586396 RepID=A0AAV0MXG2_9ROSI|nr:unnamed protein product [Linum tenue]